jgi:hypothetical protein
MRSIQRYPCACALGVLPAIAVASGSNTVPAAGRGFAAIGAEREKTAAGAFERRSCG